MSLKLKRHTALLGVLVDSGFKSKCQVDPSRMTLLYFAIVGIAACGGMQSVSEELRERTIEWVYAQQISREKGGGFRMTPTIGEAHVTAVHCALLVLLMCGDDLSRVDAQGVGMFLASVQQSDGSFRCTANGESDARFLYSAIVSCKVLSLFNQINKSAAITYALSNQRYDGGFAGNPYEESHGGNTFCCVASLAILDSTHLMNKTRALKWLTSRLVPDTGFNGRPNKLADTCYNYWVGVSIKLLTDPKVFPLIEPSSVEAFTKACECETGGIAKDEETRIDILHTTLPILGLSNLGVLGELPELDPTMGCLKSAIDGYVPASTS